MKSKDIDEQLLPLKQIQFTDQTIWEEIEMQYALFGKDINQCTLMFFLLTCVYSQTMLDLTVACIKHLKHDMFNDAILSTICSYPQIKGNWFGCAKYIESTMLNDMNIPIEYVKNLNENKLKYRLIECVEQYHPIEFLNWYSRHSKQILHNDYNLARFVLKRSIERSKTVSIYKQISMAIMSEMNRHSKIESYMN